MARADGGAGEVGGCDYIISNVWQIFPVINLKGIKPERIEYPSPLKGMNSVSGFITKQQVNSYKEALDTSGETEIHNVLKENPQLMRDIMPQVGHHGMWFVSKPQIRPPLINGKRGKIPDFLLAGRGSTGMGWFLVELKSPQDRLFNKERFSSKANEGLNQLASYLSYANEKQGFLRDALEIPEFRTPKGILVIGRGNETEQNENSRELKAFWNDNLKNIEIISYDKILHTSFSRIQHQ